jgi:hypothetical protein
MSQEWKEPSDAFWAGFRDGYEGSFHTRSVTQYHEAYELGLILGWTARNKQGPQI